jgi:cystathionine beta-lyase/cystathionine gamma-synthase
MAINSAVHDRRNDKSKAVTLIDETMSKPLFKTPLQRGQATH